MAAVVWLLTAAVQGVSAGTGQPAAPATGAAAANASPSLADPNSAATVLGNVWGADGRPVSNLALRLRDIVSGQVESTTSSSEGGEFRFENVSGSTYVVECLDERGTVIAAGVRFSVAPGETIATFVRLGSQNRGTAGFFRSIAASVVSAAAGVGVTAIGTPGRPISPNR